MWGVLPIVCVRVLQKPQICWVWEVREGREKTVRQWDSETWDRTVVRPAQCLGWGLGGKWLEWLPPNNLHLLLCSPAQVWPGLLDSPQITACQPALNTLPGLVLLTSDGAAGDGGGGGSLREMWSYESGSGSCDLILPCHRYLPKQVTTQLSSLPSYSYFI